MSIKDTDHSFPPPFPALLIFLCLALSQFTYTHALGQTSCRVASLVGNEVSRLVTHAHPRTSTRSPTQRHSHTDRGTSALSAIKIGALWEQLSPGNACAQAAVKEDCNFQLIEKWMERKMWGKCAENPLASHDFSHVFRCRFGFQVPALVSCEKRSEIRDQRLHPVVAE